MKVCLVTLIDNTNYGTFLQAFASAYIFEKLDNDVIFLNYHRNYYSPLNCLKRRLKSNSNIVKKVIDIPTQLIFTPLKNAYLSRFLKNKYSFSKRVSSYEEVRKLSLQADIYVAGSDQIWNTEYNNGIDPVFYLTFADNDTRKIAFSSSIGQEKFPKELKDSLRSHFEKFDFITLRESMSVPLLKDLGIKNVKSIIDPTLLLNMDNWKKELLLKERQEKYILVYCVESDKSRLVVELAKKLANKKGFKVYIIENGNPLRYSHNGVSKIFLSPSINRMVELFYNAQCTIVSSFHGVAFSINFNKPFIVLKPNKFNVRIESLLSDLNILTCMKNITGEEDLSLIENIDDIDYEKVNSVLDEKRRESMALLNTIIRIKG